MRKQEGKCRFKPAPENTIEVNTTFPDVNLTEMDLDAQEQLMADVQEIVADTANEEPEAVEVTLSAKPGEVNRLRLRRLSEGGVIVSAVLDLEERIGIMEGEQEGQDVDLVQEMDSLKAAVKNDLGKSSVKNEILTKAKNNEGMQAAASGEITMTDLEAEMTAESATKAPTEAPEESSGDGDGTSTDETEDSSGNGVDDGSYTFLSTTPAASADNGGDDSDAPSQSVDAAVNMNAFSGVLFGSVVVVVMQ